MSEGQTPPKILEKDAYEFLACQQYADAFKLFNKAAEIYKAQNNHEQSALCFASAASCWAIKSGEETFFNAAHSYEQAAEQAELSRDFEYASLLYKYAAISYERDTEFISFSECFYRSKECYRKFLGLSLANPKKIHYIRRAEEIQASGKIKRFFLWFALTFSYLLWGHGERPIRTLAFGIALILISALFYLQGSLLRSGTVIQPDFFEATYFSMVTFTTVGYGDLTPVGLNRLVAMTEGVCALFIVPLFTIGLSRRYLRV